ncbi:helix-turn-helix domain-containing protein [Streptomyces xanthochromogenes]|uniref:helix-turn-helix domain-containing protein n=1 Tax=Streptomyces xanthochromogenes TaxID=67384 RepID=UPI0034325E5F
MSLSPSCRVPFAAANCRNFLLLKFTNRKNQSLVIAILVEKNRLPDRMRVVGDGLVRHREGEIALLNQTAVASDRTGGAVARTMAVLRALGRLGPGEQPLAAIAASAQLPAPTVHRYLQALLRDGTVEQRGPRAAYALVDALHGAPHVLSAAQLPSVDRPSPAVKAEIVTLQSRTGQIVFVYRPHLIGTPARIAAERAFGAHTEEVLSAPVAVLRALECAPLEADAAGLAILSCLGSATGTKIDLAYVREEGHAMGPSPLPGRTMIAAPLWYGSAVAGSIALLAGEAQVRAAATRARYVGAVMDAAAAMSGQLTRSGVRRAS